MISSAFRRSFGLASLVVAGGVWAVSCGEESETPPPNVPGDASFDAARVDSTTGADASGNGDAKSTDSGVDSATSDSSLEASTDAGVDASADAGVDAADCIFDFAEGGPFLEARPYRSAADSPFTGCSFPSYFYLANFEGDSGLPPGTTANGGSKYPGAGLVSGIVDSVDGDDGFPDGGLPDAAPGGHPCVGCQSWFGNPADFSFDETTLGGLPTRAGIVWTDDGVNCTVTLTAYGADGGIIGAHSQAGVGTGGISGETDEDRFFGVVWDAGIKRIRMTHTGNGMESDHLQIGR